MLPKPNKKPTTADQLAVYHLLADVVNICFTIKEEKSKSSKSGSEMCWQDR